MTSLSPEEFTSPDYEPGDILHIVLFTFVDTITDDQRREVERRFLDLASSDRDGRRYIASIVSGAQMSLEQTTALELGFVVTFRSQGDRNFYVGEPIVTDPAYFDHAHAAFKEFVGPLVADVVVFDLAV